MKTLNIERPGKSKADIMKCLEKLEGKFSSDISKYNISVTKNDKGYALSGSKKILFQEFKLNANLIVEDGSIKLEYESNIPAGYEKDAIGMIEKEINAECS